MIQVDAFSKDEYLGMARKSDIKQKMKDDFMAKVEQEISEN